MRGFYPDYIAARAHLLARAGSFGKFNYEKPAKFCKLKHSRERDERERGNDFSLSLARRRSFIRRLRGGIVSVCLLSRIDASRDDNN